MKQALRRTGIEVIGNAPWGTHFCQFYETRQDLLEILVPYFRQGLADNEFCMWVTSEPVEAGEAKAALAAAEPELDDLLRQGRIEILDYRDWYLRDGGFNPEEVLQGWVDKLQSAQARGLEGLRLTGNTFWLERQDWAGFTAYEEAVNRVIGQYRMLAVCTYSLGRCGALEIMDVLANHRFALVKREGRWQTVESSERRIAEAALAESEQKYSAIFDKAPFAMALTRMPDGTLVEVNDAFLQLFEYRREEVIGKTSLELAIADPASRAQLSSVMRERGAVQDFECPRVTRSGASKTLSLNLDWVSIGGQRHILTTIRDVTERKLAEQALRELSQFPQQNPHRVLRISSDGLLSYANASAREWLSVLGQADEGPLPEQLLAVAAEARRQDNPLSIEVRDPTGKVTLLTAVRPPAEDYVNLYGIDITERKRSEERLRRFYESGLVGIIYWRMDGLITDANDKFLQMVGYSRQELSSGRLDWSRLTPPEYRRRDEESMAELKATGFNKSPFEKEYIRQDGRRIPVLVGGAMLDEERLNGVAVVVDISKRKQAEEAWRQSQEDLNRAQEVGQLGSWRLDVKRDVLSWSDEAYRIFGVPKGTPQTYETFLQRVHPDDRQRVDAKWKAALAGEAYDLEHRLLADGRVKWVREKAFLEFDGAGEPLGGFGIAQDITERKRIEQELERLAQQRQLALDAADLGWWRYDPAARVASWDEGVRKMFGVADYGRPLPEILALLHPADLQEMRTKGEEALDPLQPKPFSAECRLRLPDGSERWVEAHGLASFEGEGQARRAVSFVGTVADITERKQAEKALKESYEQLDRFNRAMVGREARMIELKKQVNELRLKAGQAPLYPLDFEK